jgi:serine/threonine protein kinase
MRLERERATRRGEADLRHDVEALLASSEEAGDFIEKPALQHNASTLAAAIPDPAIGRRVGPYRVIGEIGSGGMGTVYRAVRADDHFRQQVAIKIVKRGMDTDFILRRFRNERQILAGLEHPNIARLLDGGATEDGLPYYVMEFIEGSRTMNIATRSRPLPTPTSTCRPALEGALRTSCQYRDIKPGIS